MYTLCWSAKGGVGTTVVASALALLSARRGPTLLIDLGGDAAAALGMSAAGGPGIGDWLTAPHATGSALERLAIDAADRLRVVGPGRLARLGQIDAERLAAAACTIAMESSTAVIIDTGPHIDREVLHHCAGSSLVVLRPCYLALRRSVQYPSYATGAIVIDEPARALGVADVERALDVPVLAEVRWDPAVSRAVDSGMLASRLPATLSRPLGQLHLPTGVA